MSTAATAKLGTSHGTLATGPDCPRAIISLLGGASASHLHHMHHLLLVLGRHITIICYDGHSHLYLSLLPGERPIWMLPF